MNDVQRTELLEAALSYARRGLKVLPLHSIEDGHCSCRKGRDCNRPTKHPRTRRGVYDATTDPATIRTWWERWPTANIGIRTGDPIAVIDVDRHDG